MGLLVEKRSKTCVLFNNFREKMMPLDEQIVLDQDEISRFDDYKSHPFGRITLLM